MLKVKQEGDAKKNVGLRSSSFRTVNGKLEVASVKEETSLKRSTDDDVRFVAKRPRKELDFYLREMEHHLRCAFDCAKQGNRMEMEGNLEDAEINATSAGALSGCQIRSQLIRKQLGNEKEFYFQEMENNLRCALDRAKQGDRMLMEGNLEDAENNATSAGALSGCQMRSHLIRKQLGSEKEFYTQQMEQRLQFALTYAKQGNRVSMKSALFSAESLATKAGALSEYQMRSQSIRKQGTDKILLAQEADNSFRDALRSAKDGNKARMELQLSEFKRTATDAGYHGIEKRIVEVTSAFYGTTPETKLHVRTGDSTRNKAPPKKKYTTPNEASNIGSLRNDDIVVVQKAWTSKEIIANRVKRAESNGEMIHLP